MSVLEAALRYAAAGVYVFPTHLYVRGDGRKGVRPIDDWDAASTTDPAVITAWFTGPYADAALCIDCGKSGIAGIDQDVAEGKDGLIEWEKLDPTPTWRARSPTGGAHDYYRANPEHPFTVDNVGTVADGVDVRGVGGFLFAPPSIDPRGGGWTWVDGEPDWANLPPVPAVVIERMEGKAANRRPKASPPAEARPQAPIAASQLFGSPSQAGDFGPGGGRKKKSDAGRLLTEKLNEFTSRTTEGSARSHYLAQELGVLAGHGVDVFWTYDEALQILMDAAEANGFIATNGYAYAEGQARRGLDYGMNEPWMPVPESAEQITPQEAPVDAVDALIAEMLTADQMQERPTPQYLIKGLLNLDSESWIIGEPGCKKSFVVLDQMIHVVKGLDWRGHKVSQGPVVMIVAEGAGGTSTRIKAWQKEYGPIGPGLYMLPRPVQAGDAGAWAVLAAACKKLGAVGVVVDTQARVTLGLKENDATDMGVYTHAVGLLREATGACVLTIHHTGRNGGDARGSSAIDGAQGTELKVLKDGPLAGTLHTEKQKDMPEGPDVPLSFKSVVVGADEDGDEITSLVLVPQNAIVDAVDGQKPEQWEVVTPSVVEQILAALRDHGGERGLTQAEAKGIVLERFHGGRKDALHKSTWSTGWTRALKRDEVIVDTGRALIDPLVDEGMSD